MGRLLTLLRSKGGADFSPLDLPGLALWLDASDYSTQTVSYAGANILPDGGGLYLPGTTGNYAATPHNAGHALPDGIDARIHVALDDWTPSAYVSLANKWLVANAGFALQVKTGGSLALAYTVDGSTTIEPVAGAVVPAVDGAAIWVRSTRSTAEGVVRFYTSGDGVSWTQLGASAPAAHAGTPIFASTVALAMGGLGPTAGVGGRFPGRIFRAQVYNGIDGTLVFDADFTKQAAFASSFTEDSANAATVTVNTTSAGGAVSQWDDKSGLGRHLTQGTGTAQPATGTRTINGLNVLDFDGGDYLGRAFALPQPFTVFSLVQRDVAGSFYAFGHENAWGLFYDSQYRLFAGAALASGDPAATPVVVAAVVNGATSSVWVNGSFATGNAGTGAGNFAQSFGVGARGTFLPMNGAVGEMVLCSGALSTDDIGKGRVYFANRWGVAL